MFSDERTRESRRRVLALTSMWLGTEPLLVVLSAGASGDWEWAAEWRDAMAVVASAFDARFVVREVRRGR